MLRLAAILTLLAVPALAQTPSPSYLIFPDQASCFARSAQQAQAMGATGDTIYWWDCSTALNAGTVDGQTVAAGSYAMTVQPDGSYGPNGLTAQEQSQLVSQADLSALMQNPNGF